MYNHGGTTLVRHLHCNFLKIWKNEEVPQELKDASIVTIVKKGSRIECGNYPNLPALSRWKDPCESYRERLSRKVLSPKHSAVSDQDEALRTRFSLPVRCRRNAGKGCDICLAFIDLTKAFDSVNREAMWACLAWLGCPPKCVNIIRQLHEGMKRCVLYDGE